MIKQYTQCNRVTIIDVSDVCAPCSIASKRIASKSVRFLEVEMLSEITFEIVSHTHLIKEEVIENLNNNIDNANKELSRNGTTFRVKSNFTEAVIQTTTHPHHPR